MFKVMEDLAAVNQLVAAPKLPDRCRLSIDFVEEVDELFKIYFVV